MLESETDVDLLITDISLPGIDGPRLAAAALKRRPYLAVLYITAHASGSAVRTNLEAAGARVVAKPFTLASLLGGVRQSLAKQPVAPTASRRNHIVTRSKKGVSPWR